MVNAVATLVLVAILGAAIAYIVRQKRAGVKCVGCSVGQECANRAKTMQMAGGCGCGCGAVDEMLLKMEQSVK